MELKKVKELSQNINHIAFIMDGNRRWAIKQGMEKTKGHKYGVDALREILKTQIELNIKTTTFFAFSRDNKQKRSPEEYTKLMDLFVEEFDKLIKEINNKTAPDGKKVKVEIFGDYQDLREDVVQKMNKLIQDTKDNKDYFVNFCINYDGQYEILQGVKKLLKEYENEKFDIDKLTEQDIKNSLWSKNFKAPEVIVRTGDSPRLSGFLTWDSQYSEIFFSEKMWPEFTKEDFYSIVLWFNKVDRKFGK